MMTFKINYKWRAVGIFLWIILALSITGATSWAEEMEKDQVEKQEPTMIKVGLAREVTSVQTRVDAGSYVLIDETTNLPIASLSPGDTISINKVGTSVQIVVNGAETGTYKGPILLRAVDNSQLNLFSYQNVKYRNNLRILSDDLLAAVNIIDVEKYLYGVVGPEMGLYAPIEALKAQAIVSRSFALNLYRPSNRWDVGIDILTQVYRGYNAEILPGGDKALRAVDETKGLVIYYQYDETKPNRPIPAYFHANAGGYTENSENVWLTPLPYMVATASPYDQYAMEYPNQTKGWPANTYQWTESFTREQIIDLIEKFNANNNNGDEILIGELEDIQTNRLQRNLQQETLSGRITQVDFIGNAGTVSIQRERTRTFFGLKSQLYTLRLDSELAMAGGNGVVATISKGLDLIGIGSSNNQSKVNGNQNNYFVIGANNNVSTIPKIFEEVVFKGKGHGHGLGMSQWGAMGMANAGYNNNDIIQHYYNQGKKDNNIVIKTYRSY